MSNLSIMFFPPNFRLRANTSAGRNHLPVKNGFTLIELLVVISIIGVLVALALGVFGRASKSADQTTSVQRIRGLSTASALYAADHDGNFVPIYGFDETGGGTVAWHCNAAFLEPLIGKAKVLEGVTGNEGVDGLPVQVLDPTAVRAKQKYWSRISGSYGYIDVNVPPTNVFIHTPTPNVAKRYSFATLAHPSKTCQFMTATDWIVKYFEGRTTWVDDPSKAVEGKTGDGKIAYRYGGKAVAAFYDGHTEMVSADRIKEISKKDPLGGRGNVFWGGDRE